MQINLIGMVLAAENPTATAAWFTEHFGFAVGVDLGWYVNTQHASHTNVSLDFIRRDHESWNSASRGKTIVGAFLAFLVEDVDAEHERLTAAGLDVVLPLVSEPWGQRRFQVAGPDGLVVEVLSRVAPDAQWMAENFGPDKA
jgi:uncharacterized glyoxalase superfamily protein PhnB